MMSGFSKRNNPFANHFPLIAALRKGDPTGEKNFCFFEK